MEIIKNYKCIFASFAILLFVSMGVKASGNNNVYSKTNMVELQTSTEPCPIYIFIGTMNPAAGAGMKSVKQDGKELTGRTGSYWSPGPNKRCLIDYFVIPNKYGEISITIEFNSRIKSCNFLQGLYIYSGGVGYTKVEVRGSAFYLFGATTIGTINY